MKPTHLLLLLVLATLTGCFSLGRDAPPEKYFVLGGSAMPDTATPSDALSELRLGLRQVRLADYLDRQLIAVRQGVHRIQYSEFDRWGETLNSGVSRALAGYLRDMGRLAAVDEAPWVPRSAHDYLIQIHVLHLEGLASEVPTDLEGGAHVKASWEIIDPQDGAVLARGATDYEVDGWTVGDYAALVDLLDAGLWELSDDLIAALTDLGD